ncbi:hypothetical protein DFJ77DRAFT_449611 [Powellomyces hirtus]|nr:hypothetical protein DFJ77DRAFT_449611 [Powellomyces hirtus]
MGMGLVEFKTFVVVVYPGRAAHIHMKVYLNATKASNDTITAGTIVHTGQVFFNASIKTQVHATSPYADTRHAISNKQNNIFISESGGTTRSSVRSNWVARLMTECWDTLLSESIRVRRPRSLTHRGWGP